MTWKPDEIQAVPFRVTPLGWIRVATKGLITALLVFGGLVLLLLLRLPEALIHRAKRPWTSPLVMLVSRNALRIIGLPMTVMGRPMTDHGGMVANHSSWLDIFALSAVDRFYFVSKSEVAGWAVIGWLARATGTVFIQRDRKDTRRQQVLLNERLELGHRLLFFPEGTSTDGLRVLPFKSTLFEPFLTQSTAGELKMQPVTVIYRPPMGADVRFYGWWGDMAFAPHLLKVLAAPGQGAVKIVFHDPIDITTTTTRKDLAAQCEAAIRGTHPYGKI